MPNGDIYLFTANIMTGGISNILSGVEGDPCVIDFMNNYVTSTSTNSCRPVCSLYDDE